MKSWMVQIENMFALRMYKRNFSEETKSKDLKLSTHSNIKCETIRFELLRWFDIVITSVVANILVWKLKRIKRLLCYFFQWVKCVIVKPMFKLSWLFEDDKFVVNHCRFFWRGSKLKLRVDDFVSYIFFIIFFFKVAPSF